MCEYVCRVRLFARCAGLSSFHSRFKHTLTNSKGRGASSNQWLTRQLNDPYVIKAKRLNYRARSAFKLLDIQERYSVISPGDTVLDCGCAPGAWSQVALQFNPVSDGAGCVVGVDIQSVAPIPGVQLIRGDFTTTAIQCRVVESFSGRKMNVVLSDMAPKASGVRELDHDCIVNLCYSVLRFSLSHLEIGGCLLMKLWSGRRQQRLIDDLSRFFSLVRNVKPPSSRGDSAELFLLATQFVGAKKSGI